MKKRKVWRYWCEFCNKGGCSGGAISKHEHHCCKNPNRECRMCGETWPRPALIAALDVENLVEGKDEKQVAALREAANGCPACMLTAILQAPLPEIEHGYDDGEAGMVHTGTHRLRVTFDFNKEKERWWADKNAEERRRDERATYF